MNLEIKEHYFYIIDDAFFERFDDPYLRGNDSENRPHYYAFKEEDTGLYWMIPCSSRVEKYRAIIQSKEAKNRPVDILHIINLHQEAVLLIQDMFPVSQEYLKRNYTVSNHPLKIVDTSDLFVINKKAKKIRVLIKKGIKFTPKQPDVLKIERELLES